MINLIKQPIDCKAALKQSIKDDMEIVMIAFNHLMDTRKSKCDRVVNKIALYK